MGALALRGGALPLGPAAGRADRAPRDRRRRLGGLVASSGAPGEKAKERAALFAALNADETRSPAGDALRRALVETLLHGNRATLVEALDETLLGVRPRPASVLAA